MSGFSGAVKIAPDALDDFIAPSQDCVVALDGGGKLRLQDVDSAAAAAVTGEVALNRRRKTTETPMTETPTTFTPMSSGGRDGEALKVSLSDCLACSGCVTSAETVLLEQQSVDEFVATTSRARADGLTIIASVSPQSVMSLGAAYGMSMEEARGRLSGLFKSAFGAARVFDTSFSRDLALVETYAEFSERHRNVETTEAPMVASACPGWVCYAEKTHGELVVPLMARTKSPQQIMGTFVKTAVARDLEVQPGQVYHVSVMPCYDKKLEASRDDFVREGVKDVDVVLTTGEVTALLEKAGLCHLRDAPANALDTFKTVNECAPESAHAAPAVSSSGGYAEYVFRRAAAEAFNVPVVGEIEWVKLRNADMREAMLSVNGEVVLRVAVAYGFRNIQNLIRSVKLKKCKYHFVEVMACPSGCLNGGGQIPARNDMSNKELIDALDEQYRIDSKTRPMTDVAALYQDWIGGAPGSQNARDALRTNYHIRAKTVGAVQLNNW
jgi:iron only hydrogenase large subunit-like protein